MSPAPAADGAIFVSLAPPEECEHDPTILLFSLTCSMAYSVLTRAFLGVWCDQTAVRVTPISKFASPRARQGASQANGEHVSAGDDGGSRKMADVNRVYLDGVQP
jgi:hypothetical protein